MEPLTGAGLEPVQESLGQKTADCSDTTQDTHWRTLVQLTDVPRTYTFAELSALLEVNESTLRKRWWEKLELAYQHCPEALRVEVRTTKAGSPVFAFTEFGLQVFQEFKAANESGYGDRYLQAVALQYPVPTAPAPPQEAEPAAFTVEVGNHAIVLAPPQLPQTYSLETLRQSEVGLVIATEKFWSLRHSRLCLAIEKFWSLRLASWLVRTSERIRLGFACCLHHLVHQVTRTGFSDSKAAGCFTLAANWSTCGCNRFAADSAPALLL
jgi:hypothetical protein